MLSSTTAAKVCLVCRAAADTGSCHCCQARPALSPGATGALLTQPFIPSLHPLALGWHKYSCSCLVTWVLPSKRQQAGPSLLKTAASGGDTGSGVPHLLQKPVLIPQQPDQTTEVRHKMTSFIGIAKGVTTSSCSSICNLL